MNAKFRLFMVIFLLGMLHACKKEQTGPPIVTTESATSITNTSVTLNGSVNPNNLPTTITFEYGLTTSYGQTISTTDSILAGANKINVSVDLTGLTSGLTYHYRLKADNKEGIVFGGDNFYTTSVKDYDGNIYNFITIGNQVWMKENLRTTTYSDGTPIQLVNTVSTWGALDFTSKAYCWPGDNVSNKELYGALYTWAAAMNGVESSDANPSGLMGVCPSGWHVPSDNEWKELETYLGGGVSAGGKLKEIGTTHWLNPNTGATNETNFTALPGGWRLSNGNYSDFGIRGYWWSSTLNISYGESIRRLISYISQSTYWGSAKKDFGLSIRCIRD